MCKENLYARMEKLEASDFKSMGMLFLDMLGLSPMVMD